MTREKVERITGTESISDVPSVPEFSQPDGTQTTGEDLEGFGGCGMVGELAEHHVHCMHECVDLVDSRLRLPVDTKGPLEE